MRRALPASATRVACGSRPATIASPIASACESRKRVRASPASSAASAAIMFSWAFLPKPGTSSRRPSSTAWRRSSSEVTPRFSCSARTRFGPSPGMRVISTRPAGIRARSLSADGIVPPSSSASIFSAIVSPDPRQLLGPPGAREVGYGHPGLADRLRSVPIGHDPVDHCAVELVQAGQLVEGVGYLGVSHGAWDPGASLRGRAGSLACPADLQRGREPRGDRRADRWLSSPPPAGSTAS